MRFIKILCVVSSRQKSCNFFRDRPGSKMTRFYQDKSCNNIFVIKSTRFIKILCVVSSRQKSCQFVLDQNLYQNNLTCFLDIFILDKSEPKFTQIYHEKIDIILSWYFHTVRVYQCGFLKSKLMKVVVLSRKNCENYSSENYISQFCLDKAAVLNHVLQFYLEEFELENGQK